MFTILAGRIKYKRGKKKKEFYTKRRYRKLYACSCVGHKRQITQDEELAPLVKPF